MIYAEKKRLTQCVEIEAIMNSLPFAYSVEYGDIIPPDDAYDLYWEGKLTDQHAFKCPGLNCKADVTLANMYKEEQELLQTPHYRCKEHESGCEYLVTLFNSEKKATSGSSEKGDMNDVFLTTRPINKTDHTSQPIERIIDTNESGNDEKYRKYTAKPKFYTIRPIVERYFIHRENGDAGNYEIRVDGKSFTYQTLFKGIMNQDIEEYRNRYCIYWGKAYINRLRNNTGYRVVFTNIMKIDNIEIRPSIIITDEIFDKYPYKRRLQKYINLRNAKKNEQYLCFVYSAPTSSQKKYINFNLSSLDFIDFSNTEYLNRLRVT